mmetsp:Transcript_19295/g.21545  ORF Transcript_19295/g.21545 Transcript_19295/m.21545 type:complete len:480 (-) Transcript_19295:125-1564(-)
MVNANEEEIVLTYLKEEKDVIEDSYSWSQERMLDHDKVNGAIQRLTSNQRVVVTEKLVHNSFAFDENNSSTKALVREGTPEYQIFSTIQNGGGVISEEELRNRVGEEIYKIGIQNCERWIIKNTTTTTNGTTEIDDEIENPPLKKRKQEEEAAPLKMAVTYRFSVISPSMLRPSKSFNLIQLVTIESNKVTKGPSFSSNNNKRDNRRKNNKKKNGKKAILEHHNSPTSVIVSTETMDGQQPGKKKIRSLFHKDSSSTKPLLQQQGATNGKDNNNSKKKEENNTTEETEKKITTEVKEDNNKGARRSIFLPNNGTTAAAVERSINNGDKKNATGVTTTVASKENGIAGDNGVRNTPEDDKEALEDDTYEDSYIIITPEAITLKNYHRPSAKAKVILRDDSIQRVWLGTDPKLGLNYFNKSAWGKASFSDVYWARALSRETNDDKHNFVLSCKGQRERHGFTVDDTKRVQSLLSEYIVVKK